MLAESGPYLHGCVVDIGCGPGFVLKALKSLGTAKHLYGLDFSLSSIKRCREEIPLGRFMIGDIYHIACEDAVFDAGLVHGDLGAPRTAGRGLAGTLQDMSEGRACHYHDPQRGARRICRALEFLDEAEFSSLLPGKLTAFQYCQEGRTMLFVVNKSMAEDG